jgi:undecaprenyl phosphate N,N'-diacetylbacillosamine 1-phosphate transferase
MYRIAVKPGLDFMAALIVLAYLSPLLLFLILSLFFAHGRAGIFFSQERTGLEGRVFSILKFKTMNDKRDQDGKLLPDQERLTAIGALLRKTSLDELPQLYNVLKGDMSLVGPRPLLPRYLPLYSKEQSRRHDVKPGITGWAQVNGRNNISWSKKFELDVWYVDHQSFILDMQILWMTFIKVIRTADITTDDPKDFQPFNGNN